MSLVKTRIIQGMVMPEGWHYIQFNPHIGATQRIESHSCVDLIQAIVDFRMTNQIPIGDPLADLEAYVCQTFPSFCHSIPGAIVSVQVSVSSERSSTPQSFVDRVVDWMEHQLNDVSPAILVLEHTALERAAICEKCPKNLNWKTACSTCNGNVDRLATLIRQGNRLVRDMKLKACAVTGQENRTAVWLKEDRLDSTNDTNAPAECWLRR